MSSNNVVQLQRVLSHLTDGSRRSSDFSLRIAEMKGIFANAGSVDDCCKNDLRESLMQNPLIIVSHLTS